MEFLSPKTHIAMGQTFLVTTLLLVAIATGLLPDRKNAVREGRGALAEAIAISGSSLVSQAEIRRLEATLGLMVERNPDLLSAGVRRADGMALVSIDQHEANWSEGTHDYSTASQLIVPIWSAGERWGQVELRFEPIVRPGLAGWLSDEWTRMMAFMSVATFALFFFYLSKMLKHLDPSQAVPPHVRAALDTLAEGLLVVDMKEQIVLANQAVAAIVGVTPDALVGQSAAGLDWVEADGTPFEAEAFPWRATMASGEHSMSDIVLLRDANRALRTFIVNCSPVMGSGEQPGGVLISLDDVTQLEEHKAELSVAKEAAESANKAKSAFLANMSHEIRTPMNAILGFTEVLKRGYVSGEPDRQRYLETIRSSGEHLLQLINDVLDLSKVESGHVEIERIRFAPHQIVQEVIRTLSVKADEKSISVDFEIAGSVPETICSDPTRFRQIVTNLLSNAIKFTNEGGVRVVAGMVRKGDAQRFALRVSDSGIGLPESSYESIFDEFVQADNSVTRRFGGTGLGLPISRRFARLMGGDIEVESEVGRGSIFTVTIDAGELDGVKLLSGAEALAASEAAVAGDGHRWEFPEVRVLVVDDGEENLELLDLVLGEVGIEVDVAGNGQVGVDKVREGRFDLVLMDMQMPVMDGHTATALLREEGYTLPIVALSANAMKGFEARCLEIGCTRYLTKPIDIDTLLENLADLLGGRRVADTGAVAPGTSETAAPEGGAAADEPVRSTDAGEGERLVSSLISRPGMEAIVRKFVGRLAEKVESMDAACAARDFEALASHGHWLKGSAGMVGFDAFTAPARRLEMLARDEKENEVGPAIDEIRRLMDRIELAGGEGA